MYEYKFIKFNPNKLEELGRENRELTTIYEGIMYFKKKIIKRVTKPKEPQKAVTKYFHENTVKGLCSFYKDLEEQYFDWIKMRANNKKKNFVQFNEASEKSAWKKLGQFPKPVAERMLEVASAQAYGMIYDLNEGDISKILEPLRQEKQKQEMKMQGFTTDDEKKKAEELRNEINDYIEANPGIRKEAKEYVFNLGLKLTPQATEKMIQTRCAMIAKKQLTK